jgi:hypothetical protein
VPDALQLRFDLRAARDVSIRQMAEVELDARSEAPVKRHLVDRHRGTAVALSEVIVPGCVHVRAIAIVSRGL